MLSKHKERCRLPHGHTRQIDVVLESDKLDANDMVVDFKALKLALENEIDRFDHRMALNSNDPLLPTLRESFPDAPIVFENEDPTTEVMAKYFYHYISQILELGFVGNSSSGAEYKIDPRQVRLLRVRVSETPSSWAEYGD